jgi:hypothetical protein
MRDLPAITGTNPMNIVIASTRAAVDLDPLLAITRILLAERHRFPDRQRREYYNCNLLPEG